MRGFRAGLRGWLIGALMLTLGVAWAPGAEAQGAPGGASAGAAALTPQALRGVWQDPDGATQYVVALDAAGAPRLISAIDGDGEVFSIQGTHFDGKYLVWTVLVPSTGYLITFKVREASPDALVTDWSGTAGSGEETLARVRDASAVYYEGADRPPLDPATLAGVGAGAGAPGGGNVKNPGGAGSGGGGVVDPGLAPAGVGLSRFRDAMVGVWVDPETLSQHTIERDGEGLRVVSVIDDDGERFTVASSRWQDGRLEWSYHVPSTGVTLSFRTNAFEGGDQMLCDWWGDTGSGVEMLHRADQAQVLP